MDEDSLTINLFWTLAFLGLLFTAILPLVLILPIVAVIGLLAFKAYKLRDKMELKDVLTEVVALILLAVAFLIPQLLYIVAGYALAKAVDIEEIVKRSKRKF